MLHYYIGRMKLSWLVPGISVWGGCVSLCLCLCCCVCIPLYVSVCVYACVSLWCLSVCVCVCVCVVVEIEPRAWCMLSKHPATKLLPHPSVDFN